VVVQPGDTLWGIARQALTRHDSTPTTPPTAAAIAAAWPRWWAANRELIGDDPDLIRPGTTLAAPSVVSGPDGGRRPG
jgi:nucleoid-associated protein YgaU